MGKSDFSWRDIITHVFGSRTNREEASTPIPIPPTLVKSNSRRLRTSRSFLIFRSPPPRPLQELPDDTSSFMSPMPKELRSRSFDGSDFVSPSSSEDSEDWDGPEEADFVRRSFADSAGIIDFFPEPPFITSPRNSPSRRRLPYRPLIPSAFLPSPPVNSLSSYGSPNQRTKQQVQDRSPTPFPYSIRHGPLQYSTASIPFDLLSRTHTREVHSGSPRSGPNSLAVSRAPSVSTSLRSSLASFASSPSSSLARSRSLNVFSGSRSQTPEPYSMSSRSTSPQFKRLSTSNSLQDLRSASPSQDVLKAPLFSCSPPSSFRFATTHVPGLEHRKSRSRGPAEFGVNQTSNLNRSHVPFGTLRF